MWIEAAQECSSQASLQLGSEAARGFLWLGNEAARGIRRWWSEIGRGWGATPFRGWGTCSERACAEVQRGRIQRSAGESACSTKVVAEICSVAAEVLGSEAAEVLGSEAAQVLGSENAQVLGSEDAQVLMHGWVSRA